MELTSKQKRVKYICCCALLLAADLIQNVDGLLPEIFTARCFIMIPAVIVLAIGEEELSAALLGLFAGMLWDVTSSVHLGFNCIFFALLCFMVSALVHHLLRDTFITNMLICSVAIILYCLIYWLCFIVIKGVDGGEMTIFSFYLPCAVYTAAVTPITYIILKPIKKKLNHK